jgi:hypothetical protein
MCMDIVGYNAIAFSHLVIRKSVALPSLMARGNRDDLVGKGQDSLLALSKTKFVFKYCLRTDPRSY